MALGAHIKALFLGSIHIRPQRPALFLDWSKAGLQASPETLGCGLRSASRDSTQDCPTLEG